MKKNIIITGCTALTFAIGMQMAAKPAKQGLMTVCNADGTELKVRLAGDEFYHQYFTEDGYPLIEKNGSFFYCDYTENGQLRESDILAAPSSKRNADAKAFLKTVSLNGLNERVKSRADRSPRRISMVDPQSAIAANRCRSNGKDTGNGNDSEQPPFERGYGLYPDLRFPAYGDQKAIVILVEYADVKFKNSYTNGAFDYFNRMLNEDGFADYGATGCAAQFFRENSGNHFRPEFDVYGPVTLAHNQSYYGGNDWWGNDQRPEEMVVEACNILDSQIDFSDYDRNHDGVVDNIFIFYAGQGEASGGSSNTVWPHSWNMTSAGYSNLVYDGVRVHTYGCSNEWEDGRPDGVGTFVHEFSHVMGLPDLYATSYTGAFTPGGWSALDYGPYNNDGMTPPNYGAFERYALGWLKPREIDGNLNCRLQPVSENVCGIIRTSKDTEFFLVENRRQEGWDAFIPGHGMLVWHVDYNEDVWTQNKVNNTDSHQYVDIEEADGTKNDYSRDGDAFPGASQKREFTPNTNPAMKTWSNKAVNFPITQISEEPNGDVTFLVLGGTDEHPEAISALQPADESAEGFTAKWEAPGAYDVLLSVWQPGGRAGYDDRLYINGYKEKNVGSISSVAIKGLDPDTEYYYSVKTSNGWETSDESDAMMAVTGRRTMDYYPVVALEAEEVGDTWFTASWEELEGADNYELTVFRKEKGNPKEDVQNFDNGVAVLRGGWKASTGAAYAMTSYAGENTPSIRLSNGDWIESPRYNDGCMGVRFWHRGNGSGLEDVINVYALDSEGSTLVAEIPVSKEKGGCITEITDFPENAEGIVLEYKPAGQTGAVAVDDIAALHGFTYTNLPIESLTAVPFGNNLKGNVTGLEPDTDYYYTLEATGGDLRSKVSNEIKVHTLPAQSKVRNAGETPFGIMACGLEISVTAGEEISVCDATGIIVAKGYGKVTLPRAGLYIVNVPARGLLKKLIVKE